LLDTSQYKFSVKKSYKCKFFKTTNWAQIEMLPYSRSK